MSNETNNPTQSDRTVGGYNSLASAIGTIIGLILLAVLVIALSTYAWNGVLCAHFSLPYLRWYEIAVLFFAFHLFFYPATIKVNA